MPKVSPTGKEIDKVVSGKSGPARANHRGMQKIEKVKKCAVARLSAMDLEVNQLFLHAHRC